MTSHPRVRKRGLAAQAPGPGLAPAEDVRLSSAVTRLSEGSPPRAPRAKRGDNVSAGFHPQVKETLSTLRFAGRAKRVRVHARVNAAVEVTAIAESLAVRAPRSQCPAPTAPCKSL